MLVNKLFIIPKFMTVFYLLLRYIKFFIKNIKIISSLAPGNHNAGNEMAINI